MSNPVTVQTAEPVVTSTILVPKVLALVIAGQNKTQIKKALKISPALLNQILESDEYRKLAEQQPREGLLPIISETKAAIGQLLTKAVSVLDHNLDEGDLQAAITVFKLNGLMDEASREQGDTSITVVLPGASEKVIEVNDADE